VMFWNLLLTPSATGNNLHRYHHKGKLNQSKRAFFN